MIGTIDRLRYLILKDCLLIVGGLVCATAIVVLLISIWLVGIYNNLVKLRERIKNAFAQIDVQLKRRWDLIPNLVETAKGYMKHEKETLKMVIDARNAANEAAKATSGNPSDQNAMKDLQASEQKLQGAMMNFQALAEGYPDLKANTNMLALQEELATTENYALFVFRLYFAGGFHLPKSKILEVEAALEVEAVLEVVQQPTG